MTKVINHDLRSVNAGTIYLVPDPAYNNLAIPDLSLPDTVKQYDIGTKYEFNGKVYHYAYTTGAVKSRWLAKTSYQQDITYRACPTTTAIYGTKIYVTTVSPDGPSGDGTFAADYMKGGHLTVFVNGNTPDNDDFSRGIIGNTAVTSAGAMTLTLDAPIPHAVTIATAIIEAMASQYASINNASHRSHTAVGIPACYAGSGTWVWVQTWGSCWCAPAATVNVLGASGLVARVDGSLDVTYTSTSGTQITSQYVGHTLSSMDNLTQSAPLIYLQIAR